MSSVEYEMIPSVFSLHPDVIAATPV